MSPLLFNLFINDLAKYLKSLNIGVSFGDEKICILLYADDIVLLAETANDLQVLLDALHDWYCTNDMNISSMKIYIVHFRPLSVPVTDVICMCGDANLSVVNKYTYLGIVFTEHLDYNVSAKCVAQSASRALGLLIAKLTRRRSTL